MPTVSQSSPKVSSKSWWSRPKSSSKSEKPAASSVKARSRDSSFANLTLTAFASVIGIKPKKIVFQESSSPPIPAFTHPYASDARKLSRSPSTASPSLSATLPLDLVPPPTRRFRDSGTSQASMLTVPDDPFARTLFSPALAQVAYAAQVSLTESEIKPPDESVNYKHITYDSISSLSQKSLSQSMLVDASRRSSGVHPMVAEVPSPPPSLKKHKSVDGHRRTKLSIALRQSMELLQRDSNDDSRDEVASSVPTLRPSADPGSIGEYPSRSIPTSEKPVGYGHKDGRPSTTLSPASRPFRPSTAPSTSRSPRPSLPPQSKLPFASTPSHSHSDPELVKSATLPRVIRRQPSLARVGPAPNAPPTSGLPPPPVNLTSEELSKLSRPSSRASAATQTPTRTVSEYVARPTTEDAAKPECESVVSKKPSTRHLKDERASSPIPTLRKASSHYSLSRKAAAQLHATTSKSLPVDDMLSSVKLKKQRSHPGVVPPLPAPLGHSGVPPQSQPQSPPQPSRSITEQRRGSGGGLNGSPSLPKKRLFSAGALKRPSWSQATTPLQDEDMRSLASNILSDNQSTRASSIPRASLPTPDPSPVQASFWDESPSEYQSPTSPPLLTPAEYMPQQIMSPADMLKVEASVMMETPILWPTDSVSFRRSRTISFASMSTTSDIGSPTSRARRLTSSPSSTRSVVRADWTWKNAMAGGNPRMDGFTQRPLYSSSWSTSSGASAAVALKKSASTSRHTPTPSYASYRSSQLAFGPPSEVGSPNCSHPSPDIPHTPDRSSPVPMLPLPPPPRRKPCPRLLTRNPSFLDIEDEAETTRMQGSFLELDSEIADARSLPPPYDDGLL